MTWKVPFNQFSKNSAFNEFRQVDSVCSSLRAGAP